ncbi:phosphate acyltransferase PlsX [Candidatus Gromoviella agglomerans]|uniref:phosphate acyltransferase PlsX n=1 Tax=Candidatus Gromoviella agglomerans TaxID=2806609 RepID=UPI001E507E9B|nr:phosphate acyltransferase PlsX [Candidatus Gromoviella agglomerans]UFX98291.1 Phosphate acyltransferase [Candidatus Gromoviella agglomerans]
MNGSCILSVDCMGSDRGLDVLIDGVAMAANAMPGVYFLLFGDSVAIQKSASKHSSLLNRFRSVDSSSVITNDTSISRAISERMKDSSMRLCLESVASGESHGALSSGNTGAYLALAKSILGSIDGIRRPAIISKIPTQVGESVMLDLGANLSCSAEILVQFAIMGSLYARYVTKKQNPSVALLNVGTESYKGSDTLISARKLMEAEDLNFLGFLEGDDIYFGKADVYVTDGFTGNISLKTAEGVIKVLMAQIKREVNQSIVAKVGAFLLKKAFKNVKDLFDPRLYNGAFWIGLKGVAVKSHGSADAFAFYCAIKTAVDIIESNLNEHIVHDIGNCL